VFALPTFYREGIPRVLLEAGALGLPLVTTDMPGCRDVVRDGWNGILVPPRNVRALTIGLLALVDAEPETLRQMGANSRRHVEQHFTLELVADACADIYLRALDRASSGAATPAPAAHAVTRAD
jgi:glycosyltransferase involved in cell wall biosynthesis